MSQLSNSAIQAEDVKTHFRACHLCEAICGLKIETHGGEVISVKGDENDPLSRGHICPKAIALKDLHEDPDRLRKPVKKVDGEWHEIEWSQAFSEIAERVAGIQDLYGNDSVAVYAGNPNVHNYGNLTHGRLLRKALQTKSNFSATSLDQLPHHFAALFLFGHQFLVPVPDIDRTGHMLIIGANPIASNGSMMTVPDVKKRLKAIQNRGGSFTVIDPRRSETAEIASQHYFIRPNSDVYFLLAFVREIFERDAVKLGKLKSMVLGLEDVRDAVSPFSLELAEEMTGIAKQDIKSEIDRFLGADGAVCYGRMGVSVQEHGTLCQWLIHLINILSGNLDKAGGAMFPSSAVGYVNPSEAGAGHFARYHTRVSNLPEFGGEFPSTALAEEILTEGDGQIKALFTLAGNPVLSSPNGRRLDSALDKLDLMVSVDIYLNETTRHADYVLPTTSPLEHDHYDLAFLRLAVRDYARYSPAVFPPEAGAKHDWEILTGLSKALSEAKGIGFKPLVAPHMLIDFGLQAGMYGKQAGHSEALTLQKLKDQPSGIDLGPLKEGLADRICTSDKMINLFIPKLAERLCALLKETSDSARFNMMLIGRRHVRSNNSWMHNFERLVKGKPRFQALVHPADLAALSIEDGGQIEVETRVGKETVMVSASDEVMQGVVSIPHGWGHSRAGTAMKVAERQGGISVNDLVDDQYYDPLTGNAALNGVPCRIAKA
jgi:anaerobic selenocysteine-containing dehydrogenase